MAGVRFSPLLLAANAGGNVKPKYPISRRLCTRVISCKHCILIHTIPAFHSHFEVFLTGGTKWLTNHSTLGLYTYNAMICPMEAIHGRESALHNAFSGAILGGIGVQKGLLSIPFVDNSFFYRC